MALSAKPLVCLLLTAAPLLGLASPPHGDEVRLTDGRVLVGAVKRDGDTLQITTRTGVVKVRHSEVSVIRLEKELRAEVAGLAKAAGAGATAFTQLQLARTAHGYQLEREMWRHLDRCVVALEDGTAAQRQLRQFLGQLEPELLSPRYRQAKTAMRVRGLVRQVRPTAGAGKRAAVVELLVREPGAVDALRRAARREPLPEQRLAAIEALQRRDPQGTVGFVQLRTVLDRDAGMRKATAELVAAAGAANSAVRSLAAGLMHDAPVIRKRTAEAFANMKASDAVPLLVAAGPLAGTPRRASGSFVARSHMFQTTTRSIIRDFDVEIAQAAAVANPVIGTAQSGVVLDVAVPAVITQRLAIERSYRKALKRLTGSDPGRGTAGWDGWLAARSAQAPADAGK